MIIWRTLKNWVRNLVTNHIHTTRLWIGIINIGLNCITFDAHKFEIEWEILSVVTKHIHKAQLWIGIIIGLQIQQKCWLWRTRGIQLCNWFHRIFLCLLKVRNGVQHHKTSQQVFDQLKLFREDMNELDQEYQAEFERLKALEPPPETTSSLKRGTKHFPNWLFFSTNSTWY